MLYWVCAIIFLSVCLLAGKFLLDFLERMIRRISREELAAEKALNKQPEELWPATPRNRQHGIYSRDKSTY